MTLSEEGVLCDNEPGHDNPRNEEPQIDGLKREEPGKKIRVCQEPYKRLPKKPPEHPRAKAEQQAKKLATVAACAGSESTADYCSGEQPITFAYNHR